MPSFSSFLSTIRKLLRKLFKRFLPGRPCRAPPLTNGMPTDERPALPTNTDDEFPRDARKVAVTETLKNGDEELHKDQGEGLLNIPTWDTRHPPNVTPKTRVIAILGLSEDEPSSMNASPTLGDGWMVSDFYLWLNLLKGMGTSQEWITCLKPKYLLRKYGRQDKTAVRRVEKCKNNKHGDQILYCENEPFQTKCAHGLLHGDEFETRAVVLDDETLKYAKKKVSIERKGVKLREYFLDRLRNTLELAAAKGEHVLIMMFAQGSLEPRGGLAVGIEIGRNPLSNLLSSDQIVSVLADFPGVELSIYMTSCYSGHWISTPTFRIDEDGQWSSDVFWLQDAKNWSPARRHAQAITSKATLRSFFQQEPVLPDNANTDAVHSFHQTNASIVAGMYRLCLPGEVADYGSAPLFSDSNNLTSSWRSNVSYEFGAFEENYNSLRKVKPTVCLPLITLQPTFRDSADEMQDWEIWSTQKLFDGNYTQLSCGYGCTLRGITSIANTIYLAEMYRSVAEPLGGDGQLGRYLSRIFFKPLAVGHLTKHDIFRARREFIYRLNEHKCAQDYADSLNLYHLPAIDSWQLHANSSDCLKTSTANEILSLITNRASSPFHEPEFAVGMYETKQARYLAHSMAAAGYYTKDDAKRALETLKSNCDGWMFTDFLAWRYLGSRPYVDAVSDARSVLRNAWYEHWRKTVEMQGA